MRTKTTVTLTRKRENTVEEKHSDTMYVGDFVKRDGFYSDLTPITNDIITTGTLSSSGVRTLAEITNNLASQTTPTASTEALLTDSNTSAFHFTSEIEVTTSASAPSAAFTSGAENGSEQISSSTKITDSIASSSSAGDYKHQVSSDYKNDAGYRGSSKKKTLIFGLLSSSFILSLL